MSNMKRLIEDYPFLNRLRKVVEGEPYPFQQVTAMGTAHEKRSVPNGYVVVTFTRAQWTQLPQNIKEAIWDNSVSEKYE